MISNNVLSADNQQERLRLPNKWYIVGLVDGEGSFHIAFYKDEKMKTNLKVIPEFHVSQNVYSLRVLKELQKFFTCGNIKVNHVSRKSDQTYVFVVRNRQDLLEKVIPFFKRNKLRTTKAFDLEIFAKVVKMMNHGKHKQILGAKQIIKLAYKMNNSGKHRSVKQTDLIKIVESSETTREAP